MRLPGFGRMMGLGVARRAARMAMRGRGGATMKEHEGGKGHFREVLEGLAAARGLKRTELDVGGLVGESAGEVYKFLEGKGDVPFRHLRDELPDKGPLTYMAVGWLMKEGKLEVKVQEGGISIRLR
jgi:hypothetical protein